MNAARNTDVVVRVPEHSGSFNAVVTDARGVEVDSFAVDLVPGLHSMTVPVSGMVSLTGVP